MPQATVATFNIHHGRGLDDRVDLERTARVIRGLDVDLVALQELDRFHPRSEGSDQPAELERLTELTLFFTATVARDGWEYGIALGTRDGALSDIVELDLPRLGSEEPRRALVGRWRGVTVIATHLASDPAANVRHEAVLAEFAAPHLPRIVVLGDLNRTARRLSALSHLGLAAARVGRGTVAPWWRRRQIDHVLVGPAVTITGSRVVPTRASDHRPMVVSLRSPVEDVLRVTYDA